MPGAFLNRADRSLLHQRHPLRATHELRGAAASELLFSHLHTEDGHSVGCDQFVYFDAGNPQRKCAPDAFVKLGVPDTLFESWKTWEHGRGTPEVCVEILSPSDTKEKLTWEEKMERYLAIGVPEVVAFNADAPPGARLRAWDRLADDLVEREVLSESTPCASLGLHWVIVAGRSSDGVELGPALRLARDPHGAALVPTLPEAEANASDARAVAAEAEIARLRAMLLDKQ